MNEGESSGTPGGARRREGRDAPAGSAPATAVSGRNPRSGAPTTGRAKGQRQDQDARALRAFLTSSAAALLALTSILVLEIVYEHVEWPIVRTEYVEIAMILALMTAFGVFALGRWRELARERIDRVRAEEELRKLSRAVEQSPASVVITDLKGDIEYVNPKFTQVTGYTFNEAVGKNPRILKSGETTQELYGRLWRTITSGREWRGEFRNKKKDGDLYWESASISPVRSPEGKITHFLSVGEDITQRKRAERDLIRAREQAEEASRAKSEFVANMSHEIRTPMNGVVGAVELLLGAEMEEEQRELAETAKRSADALLAIIDNILNFSEMEARKLSIEPVDFNLARAVEEVVDLFVPRAHEKGLELACSLPPELPASVRGDAVRVRQTLTNLVDNAIKFTEEGAVSVEVAVVGEASPDTTVRISVRDTGIGVPKDRQAAIFESFTQADGSTKRRFGGSGLGLAICHRLVKLMGGKLELESRPGKGSTFWIELTFEKSGAIGEGKPRLSAMAAGPPAPGVKGASPPVPPARNERQRGLRVLLVEDNPVNRKVSLKLLQRGGHRTDAATNGREALELVAANDYDVVLMDVQMPEMDGFEATDEIRQRERGTGRHLPIIAMTAHAMEGDRARCLSHGMDDYISKPVTAERLSTVLSTWATDLDVADDQTVQETEKTTTFVELGRIRRISAGDDAFALDLIREFLAHTPKLIASLREAISRSDGPAAVRLAHSVKGSCRILGAEEMAEVCEALEDTIGNGKPSDAAAALKNVEKNYGRLAQYLETCLKVGAI